MPEPVARWAGSTDPTAPIVVLLHGRGADESAMLPLASALSPKWAVVSLRGPVALSATGFTWFENQGIGRPVPASLRSSLDWFTTWLDGVAGDRPVALVGFSGGTAFAGAALLDQPRGYLGGALLYGTIPFDAGLDTTRGALAGVPVLHAQGVDDTVMPRDLMDRTWQYLTAESGATLTALRTHGGHAITPEVLRALGPWLDDLLVTA